MAQVHGAFLNTAQESISLLGQLAGGQAPSGQPLQAPAVAPAPPVVAAAPAPAPAPPVAPVAAAPVPAAPVTPAPVAPVVAAPVPVAPVVAAPASAAISTDELMALLLDVVSEKTGYPTEMLTMEMELEGDLGIDSIKRVEILSAMQDEVPTLPEVDTAVMAELVTLGQIVDYMASQIEAAPAPVAAAPTAAAPVPAPAAAAAAMSTDELMALLLGVVSEKTGYPTEMLTMEMELEGDLGIDSIKRVEILSAMQDEVPTLPEVDTAVMAELVTLGQIVDYMAGEIEAAPAPWPRQLQPQRLQRQLQHRLRPRRPYRVSDRDAHHGNGTRRRPRDRLHQARRNPQRHARRSPNPARSRHRRHGRTRHPRTNRRLHGRRDQRCSGADTQARTCSRFLSEWRRSERRCPERARAACCPGSVRRRGRASSKCRDPNTGTARRPDRRHRGTGIGPALVALLSDDGVNATLVDAAPAAGYAGLVFLGGLRPFGTVEDAVAVNHEAFAAARTFSAATPNAVFVTVSDLGGTAGLTALARTAAIEWPINDGACDRHRAGSTRCRNDRNSNPPRTHDRRIALISTEATVQTGAMPLGATDVVVASGGARGVAAATMIELAAESGATFILLGRSELIDEADITKSAADDRALKQVLLDAATQAGTPLTPNVLAKQVAAILANREINGTVAAIEKVGGHAHYVSVDVTDQAAIARVLEAVRSKLGPNHRRRAWCGSPGRQADHREDRRPLLCLFSSVAARTGNNGQSDYAMANEILNKVAVAEAGRRGPGCVVKSLGWGPWDGGMVGPALRAHFEAMGVSLIPLDQGARMLVDEIASPQTDQVELVRRRHRDSIVGARVRRLRRSADRLAEPPLPCTTAPRSATFRSWHRTPQTEVAWRLASVPAPPRPLSMPWTASFVPQSCSPKQPGTPHRAESRRLASARQSHQPSRIQRGTVPVGDRGRWRRSVQRTSRPSSQACRERPPARRRRALPCDSHRRARWRFTAAGAAYHGMGTGLLRALPELASPVSEAFPLGEVSSWVFGPSDHEPTPSSSRRRRRGGQSMDDLAATVHAQVLATAALHADFVKQQSEVHDSSWPCEARCLTASATSTAPAQAPVTAQPMAVPMAAAPIAARSPPAVASPVQAPVPNPVAAPISVKPAAKPDGLIVFTPEGPTWDREQLKIHSSGTISELFGPAFAAQDGREIQCRMPEPPLLLADRVTGLVAEPGVLGQGTIWTETDVKADAFYMNNGYMPAGFMIESGQADLMLISYMGIDLVNDPGRSYRLLGCTLTYHGDLPTAGETLE
ncbi:Orsellinic acid synthase ArmB [Nymphon striatum]|nr:Orsellinic acid synthase ArmB [Nymphon striatum]